MNPETGRKSSLSFLTIGALGVVYGDIGTSPLYALKECFHLSHGLPVNRENVLGILSCIFWSLFLLVSVKYLGVVMRANNKGEGGILALLSLAFPERAQIGHGKLLVSIGVFGAALLYGDGMITPTVTILSAVEGLKEATPLFEPYIQLITIAILAALFYFQRIGTGGIGRVFGTVTLIWFLAIALLGIRGLLIEPQVLASFNPWYAIRFVIDHGTSAFFVLGSVFLAVTGAEALYADMGHFGIRPIRIAWYSVVLPALCLNYLGQGGYVLANPTAIENPFFKLVPAFGKIPMVILATMAGIIASQALISGAFSLTHQAIQLGYFPRLAIKHTSSSEKGQIYIPQVNWFLMICCIGLVLFFQNSTNLAAAYGIAVSMTMLVTTFLLYFAARHLWGLESWKTLVLCSVFFLIELGFFSANLFKIAEGGWFPLLVGVVIFTLMSTWNTGRALLWQQLRRSSLPLDLFLQDVARRKPARVPGTAVFLSGSSDGTPLALLHNLKHNKILHDRNVLLTVQTHDVPFVEPERRAEVQKFEHGFYRIVAHYGFMEEPNVQDIFEVVKKKDLHVDFFQATFFLSRETIIPTRKPGMALWREHLFMIMSQNAQRATAFFKLPANRVVEIGMQVEL